MKHRDYKQLRGKGLFGLNFTALLTIEGRLGRNLEAGADAEAMEGAAYWLAPHGLLSLLSYRTQVHQLRHDPTHNRLGPPPSITNLRKCLMACLQPDFIETFSQVRLPPP